MGFGLVGWVFGSCVVLDCIVLDCGGEGGGGEVYFYILGLVYSCRLGWVVDYLIILLWRFVCMYV